MGFPPRPHVLGIDDGPFQKHRDASVAVVGVMMEGPDLVEAVATTRFPIDGEGVTGFLVDWVGTLRFRAGLQAIVLGGITIAGLAVVDVERLAEDLDLPVLVVNRDEPTDRRLRAALEVAGLAQRLSLVERAPEAHPVSDRLFVAASGVGPEEAAALVRAIQNKSELPEPLRLAHLIARAVARGESRGRP